jgi:hypothetical protein
VRTYIGCITSLAFLTGCPGIVPEQPAISGTKTIYIFGNPRGEYPGTSGCNQSIATDKGWTVDTSFCPP